MFSVIKKYIYDLKNTDLKKIKVTSEGDFYIKSTDLFDNKKNSIEFIDSLSESVNRYKKRAKENTQKANA
jgi:hypothetical protein